MKKITIICGLVVLFIFAFLPHISNANASKILTVTATPFTTNAECGDENPSYCSFEVFCKVNDKQFKWYRTMPATAPVMVIDDGFKDGDVIVCKARTQLSTPNRKSRSDFSPLASITVGSNDNRVVVESPPPLRPSTPQNVTMEIKY